MMRFLSPGSKVRPKVEAPQPKAKGRPKAAAVEGDLDLGQKRMRSCASKKAIIDEQRWKEMERRLELLEMERRHEHAQGDFFR